jgi:thiamine-phosphate pyrophosphorylase
VPPPDFDLYLVTDRQLTHGRELLWVLERALEGGVKAVQLREKDLSGKELFVLAERVRRLTERHGARVFINDRIDVALAVDADGVQLGEASIGARDARTLLGAERMIGVSTHSADEAEQAEKDGADFILFGPVYFTPSKAVYGAPQGVVALQSIVEKVSVPVYAIGGISSENLAETVRAGARGVALISAIIAAEDPRAASESLLTLLRSGRRNAR